MWNVDSETEEQIEADWQEPWGGRRQELVFLGAKMDEADLRAALDAALLDQAEMRLGVSGWSEHADPFPEWLNDAPVQSPAA